MSKINATLKKFNPQPIASALQKLFTASSTNYGTDCFLHAILGQRAMKELAGIETKIVIGYAAWRVGDGRNDTISHLPLQGMTFSDPRQVPCHAWLTAGDYLLDFTTYQLRDKARQLDQLDGGTTTVNWCPDYLFVKQNKISTLNHVSRLNAGLFFYQHNAQMENLFNQHPYVIDEEDWQNLLLIHANQDVTVFGRNHFEAEEDLESPIQPGY